MAKQTAGNDRSVERRGGTRYATELPARLDDPVAVHPKLVLNLSEDGFFLSLNKPLKLGRKVRLTLQAADGGAEISVTGQVVHIVNPDKQGADKEGSRPGIGVKLSDFASQRDRQCYLDLLSRLRKAASPA